MCDYLISASDVHLICQALITRTIKERDDEIQSIDHESERPSYVSAAGAAADAI